MKAPPTFSKIEFETTNYLHGVMPMTDYDIKLNKSEMVGLLTENNSLGQLVESVLNQVLESQMTEHLGAERYSHEKDCQGYRNGYRERKIYSRVGPLTLRVPQTRDGDVVVIMTNQDSKTISRAIGL